MRKFVLLFLGLTSLFSCSNDFNERGDDYKKKIEGIVSATSPIMNSPCGAYTGPISSYVDNPDLIYHKSYLIQNTSPDSVRVKMLFFPKFADSALDLYKTYDYLTQEFVFPPHYCGFLNMGGFYASDPGYNEGPFEIYDHLTSSGKMDDIYYWLKYPGITNGYLDKYKPALFQIQGIKNGQQTDILQVYLEDMESYQQSMSTTSGPQGLINNPNLPYSWAMSYYVLPTEVGMNVPFPYQVYYVHKSGILGNKYALYDSALDVATSVYLRYMPNVVTPNYPHENPESTPGYILTIDTWDYKAYIDSIGNLNLPKNNLN